MAEFKRARSAEQKCQRMGEIKGAARRQFDARPYHQITLTTIAGELGWARAHPYKYVSTELLRPARRLHGRPRRCARHATRA